MFKRIIKECFGVFFLTKITRVMLASMISALVSGSMAWLDILLNPSYSISIFIATFSVFMSILLFLLFYGGPKPPKGGLKLFEPEITSVEMATSRHFLIPNPSQSIDIPRAHQKHCVKVVLLFL